MARVEWALHDGADVNYCDKDGMSPLHWAVEKNNLDLVELLLQEPALLVDILDKFQCTPLSVACEKEFFPIVDLLLRKGAEVNHGDVDGWTALHWTRSVQVAKRLLRQEGARVDPLDEDGVTPLHLKVAVGDLEMVDFLLENGANVNSCDSDGYTPVQTATKNFDIQMVRLLVDKGANLFHEAPGSQSPLWMTCRTGVPPFSLGYIVMEEIDLKRRHAKSLEMAKVLLLDCGADPCHVHACGLTPLHYVCEVGQSTEILKVMMEVASDLHVLGRDGQTALHSAARGGNLEMVRLLLDYGADPLSRTKNGCTPLMLAAERNHVAVVRHLMQLQSPLDIYQTTRLLPHACEQQSLDVVKVLCEEFGMSVDLQGPYGGKPFVSACASGQLDTILYFLREQTIFSHWTPLS